MDEVGDCVRGLGREIKLGVSLYCAYLLRQGGYWPCDSFDSVCFYAIGEVAVRVCLCGRRGWRVGRCVAAATCLHSNNLIVPRAEDRVSKRVKIWAT